MMLLMLSSRRPVVAVRPVIGVCTVGVVQAIPVCCRGHHVHQLQLWLLLDDCRQILLTTKWPLLI